MIGSYPHDNTHLSWATGMLSPENMLLLGSLRLSLSFLSRASATISAALPLGQRMTGMVPEMGRAIEERGKEGKERDGLG